MPLDSQVNYLVTKALEFKPDNHDNKYDWSIKLFEGAVQKVKQLKETASTI